MRATVQKNFIIGLRAVHTRLKTLVSQAKTKGILEGPVTACADDLAHAAEDLERALQRFERVERTTTRKM